MQAGEGSPEFAGFAVVASFVIEGDGEVFGLVGCKGVSLLEEDKAEVELVFLQENHGDQVAKLAHLNGNSFVLLAIAAEVILVELQDLLVLVEGLSVFGLALKLLPLALQGLHSLADRRVHKIYYISS